MLAHNAINWTGKRVNRLLVLEPDPDRKGYWRCKCDCGVVKSINSMSLKSGQKSCGCIRTEKPHNWEDRTGKRHRKLLFLEHLGGNDWRCLCDCGNESVVSSTNLLNTNGCRNCANRKDITGERRGLLVAEKPEEGVVKGRSPLWTFRCDCGNMIEGTVREFHANWLRSCGCHDSTYASWSCMLSRCYDPKNNRYKYYGGRGIEVSNRWHDFDNFVADMGERPKRYNLGRKNAEGNYSKDNCIWEHISKNGPDTNYGVPTKPGLVKGAKPRNYQP